MVGHLIAFELKRRFKMLSSWVYALALAAGAVLLMLAAGGVFQSVSAGAGSEKVAPNSPYSLFGFTTTLMLFGVLTVGAVFGQAAAQDFERGTWPLIFTKRVKKAPYLLGRFLGAWLFSWLLFFSISAGLLVGTAGVWLFDSSRLIALAPLAYVWPQLLVVGPSLFTVGAVLFTLAALTRRMAPVYVGMVVLVLGYLALMVAVGDEANRSTAALLDPFANVTFDVVTRYWTPAERNVQLAPLGGLMLGNRALWLAVGVALLGLAVARFRTTVEEQKGRLAVDERASDSVPLLRVSPRPTFGFWLRASLSAAGLYVKEVLRSPVYWALVVAALVILSIVIGLSGKLFGTPTYPVTYQVLESAAGSFSLFVLIVITFYAGELVWRERDASLADVVDATRCPTWVTYLAKVLGLWVVALSLQGIMGIAALTAQLARGFTAIDLEQYAAQLIVFGALKAVPLCALAVFAQVLIGHKYIGHAVMVGYYALRVVLGLLGVEEPLVRWGAEPTPVYSDMNGWGHGLMAIFWLRGWWWAWSGALVVVGLLFVQRGRETSRPARRAEAKRRAGRGARVALATCAVVALGCGGVVFYDTHLLNPYRSADDNERETARYEQEYRKYLQLPQPRIIDADVKFDVYPEVPRLVSTGTYRLKNEAGQPISTVLIDGPRFHEPTRLSLGSVPHATRVDLELGQYVFELPEPLAPDATIELGWELEEQDHGFSHAGPDTSVVHNGTFVNNFRLPMVGYHEGSELTEDRTRKKHGLPPKERMADRDDPKGLMNNYLRQDSDFISFRGEVSTSADQIAILPGYLQKEWTSPDGRRHFRYAMDTPILNFFSVLSARYEVLRDEWKGVRLEIYFHPTHRYNLSRMMQGMKDALEYCSAAFGPYQHRQARIIEFPRYQQFAQSFPNTIPYSEGIGFIARVRDDDPDDVDYPYYVTAHEIAHQWWAHQVMAGNAQGATMTSETMAQYSALMVMKHHVGAAQMRRFLKYELDQYLLGRALERKKELPLGRVENQPYIHYRKGSVVMYALQDFIGEERVNRALKAYVDKVKFKGPPYTNSTELIAYLRAETPPEYQYLIDDLFETITLYDNRVESASVSSGADGGWDVEMKVVAKKFRADEQGQQHELDFDDWVDVGALDSKGIALFLEKRRVKSGEATLRFSMPVKPAKVGIDPLNKLVDRTSDDNVIAPTGP